MSFEKKSNLSNDSFDATQPFFNIYRTLPLCVVVDNTVIIILVGELVDCMKNKKNNVY